MILIWGMSVKQVCGAFQNTGANVFLPYAAWRFLDIILCGLFGKQSYIVITAKCDG